MKFNTKRKAQQSLCSTPQDKMKDVNTFQAPGTPRKHHSSGGGGGGSRNG